MRALFPSRYSPSTISRAQHFFAVRAASPLTTYRLASSKPTPEQVSQITKAEQDLTGQSRPVAGGPAAQAQSAAAQGRPLDGQIVSDMARAEQDITGEDGPVRGGPTAAAQAALTKEGTTSAGQATGTFDSSTIRAIHDAEKAITGNEDDGPVRGGPTAAAQRHAGEKIGSGSLHDITEGEKKLTGGERVKGGPTATAQSELGRSRS